MSHLQELVREGEQSMSSAQTQITCLRETQEKLKIELDATRGRVRETSNLLTDLQVRESQRHTPKRLLKITVINYGVCMNVPLLKQKIQLFVQDCLKVNFTFLQIQLKYYQGKR